MKSGCHSTAYFKGSRNRRSGELRMSTSERKAFKFFLSARTTKKRWFSSINNEAPKSLNLNVPFLGKQLNGYQ